jgi:hypothetical protein
MEGTGTEKRLRQETEKWTSKIAKKLENMEAVGSKGNGFLTNIKAYVSDSRHFLEKGDLVRSFEAMIWAWSWLEIGLELGLLKNDYISIK